MKQDAVKEEFNAYSDKYGDAVDDALAFTGASGAYFLKVKAGYLIDMARKRFGDISNLRVLDLGCGVGNFHPFIEDAFGQICGIDISDASIKVAKETHPKSEFVCYDGQNMPYEDGEFDIVFASCVLHHVPLDIRQRFAENSHRILKKGGLFVVFEHNTINPLTRKVISDCRFDDDAIMLPVKELKALYAANDFRIDQTRYILSIPSFNPVTRGIDKLLSFCHLGAQYFVLGTKA